MANDGPGDHTHPVDPQRVAAARAGLPGADEAARIASWLTLLADPVRARILAALDTVPELCVGDLAIALDVSEDSVGYALRILRTAGLVANRRAGRVVFYRLADDLPALLRRHGLPLLAGGSSDQTGGRPSRRSS